MVQVPLSLPRRIWADKRLRYLLVGGVNTAWGYGVSLLFYWLLAARTHIIVISLLGSVAAITFSFATYKFLVFRTGIKGNIQREYLRCYVVYGASMLLGAVALWLLVDMLGMAFWLAQALVMILSVVSSYIGHSRYSFSRPRDAAEAKAGRG